MSMPGPFRAVCKIILMTLWSLPLVCIQCIVLLFHKGPGSYYVPQIWHNGIAFIIGLKTEVAGEPISKEQTIFVGNHLSYLDIFGLGSIMRASFIAKEDIAHWPVIGFLSKVQQTAFISRSSDQAKKVANSLSSMLAAGKGLILFPEGTSGLGRDVLPFKSSLFSLVAGNSGHPIPVQPFTIILARTDDRPLDESSTASRDIYAWYGDMDFAPHFWKFLTGKGAVIRIIFHPVIRPTQDLDRKTLARQTWETVSSGLSLSA